MRINKVYTKAGDQGKTQLIGGAKVAKSDIRIECYGTIDELNACIGLTIASLEPQRDAVLVNSLLRIQNELFNVGTQLATPGKERRLTMPDIGEQHIKKLEDEIDERNEKLPELRSFVLPGGSQASAYFHLSRTVCRRAERLVVNLSSCDEVEARHLSYLNRLSDALFVFGRYSMMLSGQEEALWRPDSV